MSVLELLLLFAQVVFPVSIAVAAVVSTYPGRPVPEPALEPLAILYFLPLLLLGVTIVVVLLSPMSGSETLVVIAKLFIFAIGGGIVFAFYRLATTFFQITLSIKARPNSKA